MDVRLEIQRSWVSVLLYQLELFLSRPEFKTAVMLVNNQLVRKIMTGNVTKITLLYTHEVKMLDTLLLQTIFLPPMQTYSLQLPHLIENLLICLPFIRT